MTNELRPGQTRPGILVDGQEGTPYLAVVLTYEERRGALVQVPYVTGDPHFSVPAAWFDLRATPPSALIFHDPEGDVTLTGIRWRGDRGHGAAVGLLDAQIAIFGRARELRPEYAVSTVSSRIDGLHEFSRFESISTEHDRPDGRWRTMVTVHAKDEVRLEHHGVTYAIRATVPATSSGTEFNAQADAVIETTTTAGMSVDDHVVAQWPVRALLTLAFGVPLFWREHRLLDDQFPQWMVSGDARGRVPVPLLYARTVSDHEQPAVGRRDLHLPLFTLDDLGGDGLVRWLTLCDDPLFSRAVEPAVEVLNGGAGHFVEPRLTLVVFALEALGHYLDSARTRNTRLADQVRRCLDVPGVDWSQVGTKDEIAEAMANVSNDMKHPDRGHRPGIEMGLAADLGLVILRLQIAYLLRLSDTCIKKFCGYPTFRNTVNAFERNGIQIDGGRFTRTP